MPYLIVKDCENRLRTDFSGLYELPKEQDDLDRDIADAEAVVNGFVGKRYAVPVTNAQALTLVKAWCLDLFAELAYKRGPGSEIPKKIKDGADTARKQLYDVSTGAMTLAGATAVAASSAGGAGVAVVEGAAPIFKREQTEGF